LPARATQPSEFVGLALSDLGLPPREVPRLSCANRRVSRREGRSPAFAGVGGCGSVSSGGLLVRVVTWIPRQTVAFSREACDRPWARASS